MSCDYSNKCQYFKFNYCQTWGTYEQNIKVGNALDGVSRKGEHYREPNRYFVKLSFFTKTKQEQSELGYFLVEDIKFAPIMKIEFHYYGVTRDWKVKLRDESTINNSQDFNLNNSEIILDLEIVDEDVENVLLNAVNTNLKDCNGCY